MRGRSFWELLCQVYTFHRKIERKEKGGGVRSCLLPGYSRMVACHCRPETTGALHNAGAIPPPNPPGEESKKGHQGGVVDQRDYVQQGGKRGRASKINEIVLCGVRKAGKTPAVYRGILNHYTLKMIDGVGCLFFYRNILCPEV